MTKITAAVLYAIAPGANADIVNGIVASASNIAGAVNDNDLPYFLGQIAAETGGYTRIEENLFYTSTKRLRQVWPSRFKTDAAAAPYVRNPKRLAMLVYGGRLGNRPNTDDGYDCRGSGCKQTTGRYNFSVVEKTSGIKCLANPDLLRQFPGAATSALVYWTTNNLSRFAANDDIPGLTRAIQGGQLGLADRTTYTRRAAAALKTGTKAQTGPRADWLRQGSSGEPVRVVQRQLRAHGYYDDGQIDGDFGEGTDNAVREFQRANGLIADGVVGQATAKALAGAPATTQGPPPTSPTNPQANKPGNPLAALIELVVKLIMAIIGRG